ncbi:MAG: hypothetical protein D6815_07630, partial [Candidatus Dadabacteria bacterium]
RRVRVVAKPPRRPLVSGAVLAAFSLCLATSAVRADTGDREILARRDGDVIRFSDVAPELAFQIYRRRLDEYFLLKRAVEELIERRLLEEEAERRGISVDELLREEVDAKAPPASNEEVEAYLAAHPEAATRPGARERVALYLSERRRIERRLELLDRLRRQANWQILVRPPEQPRVRLDVAGAPARGPAEAPVTVVHFASFTSRRSALSNSYLERLRREKPGKIREVFIALPADRDEIGLAAAQLAAQAARRGRFWRLHDRLFALGGKVSREDLRRIAAELELTPVEPGSTAFLAEVKRGLDLARRVGVEREPVLFVNGRYFSPTFPYEKLAALVDEELGGAPAALGTLEPDPVRP